MTAIYSLPPGTLLADKFRIERLLGLGAMGAVYCIHHELTRHKRALKLLHPHVEYVPDIVRRFLNEASAAGRAGNAHLVETFDAGTLPTGEPYVVMELLEGETLGALLDREPRLDAARAVEIVVQAAEGMEAAHRAGIIHRDLKPENLFLTHRDGAPFVKILDFGVSKFLTASTAPIHQTHAGALHGSPAYMSPEQLRGDVDIDARADIFALGVVLFECLTGARPFDAPTVEALIVRVFTGQPAAIDALRPDLPRGLHDVVRSALALARDERIPTARALMEALTPFRAPSLADLESPHTPKQRWGGSRALLGIAALAILLAGVGAVLLRPRSPPSTVAAALGIHAGERSPATAPTQLPPPSPAVSPPSTSTESSHETPVPRHEMRASEPHRPVAQASASASATQQLSPAKSLGLRNDNPFR